MFAIHGYKLQPTTSFVNHQITIPVIVYYKQLLLLNIIYCIAYISALCVHFRKKQGLFACKIGGHLIAGSCKKMECVIFNCTESALRNEKSTYRISVSACFLWQGCQDSNLGMPESKSGALPLGDTPKKEKS